jgi:hypothetical protein
MIMHKPRLLGKWGCEGVSRDTPFRGSFGRRVDCALHARRELSVPPCCATAISKCFLSLGIERSLARSPLLGVQFRKVMSTV